MKLKFCGAARIVTGSCYYIEAGKYKILVDCGMFQGRKETTRLNYEKFLFEPRKIDYVFLTHAHIDHSGLLPKLKKQGFKGTIYATSATIDLCKIMLQDSAHIQEMDNMYENRRRKNKGEKPRQVLYTQTDAKTVMQHFKKVKYDKIYKINETIRIRYVDAGHIIGSAMIEMHLKEDAEKSEIKKISDVSLKKQSKISGTPARGERDIKIVFSGDIGQWGAPIINDPSLIDHSDYVLVESTYGDRKHEDIGLRDELLLKYAMEASKKKGKLLIPSFAIERTQELLYSFNKLIKEKKFPNMKVFLDSPLAIKATEIFKKHHEYFDKEALLKYKDPFQFPNLQYTRTADESKALNDYKKPCIIIAGSGMATAGRIRHHLKHNLKDSRTTVLFVGYQAEGTLGRYLLQGAKKAKMMGEIIPVKAAIHRINSFSAHADMDDLVKWVHGYKKKPTKIFIVHGETKSSQALSKTLKTEGYKTHIPKIGEVVEL